MEQRNMAFHERDMGQDGINMFSFLSPSLSLGRHRSPYNCDYSAVVASSPGVEQ